MDDELLTVEDVAVRLRVDEATVRRMADQGQFAGAFKVGRLWRIPEQGVKDYIKRQQEDQKQKQ